MGSPDAIFLDDILPYQSLDTSSAELHNAVPAVSTAAAQADRVRGWLAGQAMPLWSTQGWDRKGGFHEALGLDGIPVEQPKRMSTMAQQIHAFSVAKALGCCENADSLIDHGIAFIQTGRTARGGWGRSFSPDGVMGDATEELYDQACVLLALAHAHRAGHPDARRLGEETLEFVERYLEDPKLTGFLETPENSMERRSSSQMRLLEALLAWHQVSSDRGCMRKAADIMALFETRLFDRATWTVGEFFDTEWRPAPKKGDWLKPGLQLEWAAALVGFAAVCGQQDLLLYARKLYSFAIASGINRQTGLTHNCVTREGKPLDRTSHLWSQTEALKTAIALDGVSGQDLTPEIEDQLARLFRCHLDPAPQGLWISCLDQKGTQIPSDVPARALYRLVTAMAHYLQAGKKLC